MRIQTRLFLGTALLVLALTGTQWWLHRRQLAAIEREVGAVAQAVGKGVLEERVEVLVHRLEDLPLEGGTIRWFEKGGEGGDRDTSEAGPQRLFRMEQAAGAEGETKRLERVLRLDSGASVRGDQKGEVGGDATQSEGSVSVSAEGESAAERQFNVELTTTDGRPRFLIVSDGSGLVRRIPIPVSPIQRILRDTSHQGLAVGGGLLLLGLAAAAVQASRLTRPLRGLAAGADAVGRGELGVQVEEGAVGEIGELQRAFNGMSARLEALESERERWLERERLAQLGDLSRGLAHTLRNPLNTLGLAVEELARDRPDAAALVGTARGQIRRIDHWLRSFLALAAGDAAELERVDLRDVVADLGLEAAQQGSSVDLRVADDALPVQVVPTALRAALANLVENAVDAAPDGTTIEIEVRRDGSSAVVTVADRGPGLPAEVRRRLFAPHVTTKSEGSGMGLFLARQLVVGMHGGRLDVTDRPAGGTVAEVRLSLHESDDES